MNIFICHVPFHYYLFKSIYTHLADSFFAIPPMYDKECIAGLGGGMSAEGIYGYVKTFLEDRHVKLIDYGAPNTTNFVKFLEDNARSVVVVGAFYGMEEMRGVRIVRMMYSMGLNYTDKYREFFEYYFSDLILTYGVCYADHLNRHGLNAIAVGNPLFDGWFNGKIDNTCIDAIERRICKSKKNILYLPTHNISSSIDRYYDSIRKLASKYNVIVKLHHATFCGESNRVCKMMADPNIVTLADNFDPLVLYKMADVVLADGVSGASFDAILAGKPVLSIDVSLDKYEVIKVDKDELFIPCVTSPGDLEASVENIIGVSNRISNRLLEHLLFIRDGKAGERAAKAIIENDQKPPLSQIEKFDRGIKNSPDFATKEEIEKKRDQYLSKTKPELHGKLRGVKKRVFAIFNNQIKR